MRCRIALLLAGYLVTTTAWAGGCRLQPMQIAASRASLAGITVDLGEADSITHADAWQGPLRIRIGDGSTCQADSRISIVERPLLLGGRVLLVSTYSGSTQRVYAVDTTTCRTLWVSPAFVGRVQVHAGNVVLGRHSIALTADCQPKTR